MEIQDGNKLETIIKSSSTPIQNDNSTTAAGGTTVGTPVPLAPSSSSSSGVSSIVFTSPFEDTSGLDVFAQIAASAHPLPVGRSSITPTSTTSTTAAAITASASTPTSSSVSASASSTSSSSSNIVHQSQSQLAQSIYQNQQALRMQSQQQKRDSIESTTSKFDPRIEDEYDEEFYSDDDIEFESDSEQGEMRYRSVDPKSNSKSIVLFDTPIREETESDLMMDVDQSMNFHQRRRSPSLSAESNDLITSTFNGQGSQLYARRLSAPENSLNQNLGGGFSTRRVIHNICERKRRENIRDGFFQLQNRLPSHLANNSKLSKMEILSGARTLINEIRGRVANLSAEVSALTQLSEQMAKEGSLKTTA